MHKYDRPNAFWAVLTILALLPLFTHAQPSLIWNYDVTHLSIINSIPPVICDAEDNTTLVAGVNVTADGTTGFTSKIDVWGNLIWHTEWGNSHGTTLIRDADVSATGYFFAGGTSQWGGPSFVYATDRRGNDLWQFYPQSSVSDGFDDDCYAVCALPDGGCTIALSKRIGQPAFRFDPAIIRLDSGGDTIWCRTYPQNLGDKAKLTDMVATDDGGVLVAGVVRNMQDSLAYCKLLVLSVSADGALRWYRLYGEETEDLRSLAIFPIRDQEYVIECHRVVGLEEAEQTLLIAIDHNGDTTWTHTFDFFGPMTYLHNSSDSGLVLVNAHDDVIKFDFDGNPVWTIQSNLRSLEYEERFVASIRDGGLIVAGSIHGGFSAARLGPEDGSIPAPFIPQVRVMPNYPNPCNAETILPIWLAKPVQTRIQLYDILGRSVQMIGNVMLSGGENRVCVDVSELSSGSYICEVSATDVTKSVRITVVR